MPTIASCCRIKDKLRKIPPEELIPCAVYFCWLGGLVIFYGRIQADSTSPTCHNMATKEQLGLVTLYSPTKPPAAIGFSFVKTKYYNLQYNAPDNVNHQPPPPHSQTQVIQRFENFFCQHPHPHLHLSFSVRIPSIPYPRWESLYFKCQNCPWV